MKKQSILGLILIAGITVSAQAWQFSAKSFQNYPNLEAMPKPNASSAAKNQDLSNAGFDEQIQLRLKLMH